MYCIYICININIYCMKDLFFSYRTLGLHAVVYILFLFTFIHNIKPPHMEAEALVIRDIS